MRQSRRMLPVLILPLVLGLGVPRAAMAQEAGETTAKMSLKASRGVGNAALGLVTEIPRTIYYGCTEAGPAYGLTVGLLEGIALGVGRTVVGVYELVTFPIPFPAEYKPVLAPGDPFGAGRTTWAR